MALLEFHAIWSSAERLPRDELARLQLARLRRTLWRVYDRIPFYRTAFDAAGVQPDDLITLEDMRRFPYTTKTDLRRNYPYGLLAVPVNQVLRLHATSGTQGKPTLVGYTRADLDSWSETCARLLTAVGCRPGHLLHLALNYGLFTGALGVHYGAERIGCTVLPAGAGQSMRQIELMRDLRPHGIKATPSFALHLAEVAEGMGVDPRTLGLRYGAFGAEPWSEAMRQEIERRWGLRAYDSYGLSEMYGPGVAYECTYRNGLHISEDHFFPEIIDPSSGDVVGPGEEGELVLTSLTKEAQPLVRYRTGDRTALLIDPCPCGRTTVRLARIKGRVDDMLILRGVNLFPSEIERVLLRIDALAPHYQVIARGRQGVVAGIEVVAELGAGAPGEAALADLAQRVRRALKDELGVSLEVTVKPPGGVPRSEGGNKALRVIRQDVGD